MFMGHSVFKNMETKYSNIYYNILLSKSKEIFAKNAKKTVKKYCYVMKFLQTLDDGRKVC